MIVIFIIVVLLISIMEILPLSKQKCKGDLFVFIIMTVMILTAGIIYHIYPENIGVADIFLNYIVKKGG